MTVDAHHHLWKYTAEEFGWIADDALRRDFSPSDLKRELDAAGVDRTVVCEARQSVAETDMLLAAAEKSECIAGVVGWLPIADAEAFPALLERYAANPKLVGLRHVVQDEPDDAFILREDFGRGVAAMRGTGLVYDILVFQRQLANAIRFVDAQADDQVFVLDHVAKPRPDAMVEWAGLVREMARRPNVVCKFSGVVTEVGTDPDVVRRVFDTVLEAFGPDRLMWGSDWPVVTARLSYVDWFARVRALVSSLSAAERASILGETASRIYRIRVV